MRQIRNVYLVKEMMRQKQELEVRLAWDLLDTFNSTPNLINPIRRMAELALEEMKALKKSSPAGSAAVTKAWQARSNCSVGRRYPAGINSIQIGTLDAQECAEIYRLYTTFVEMAGELKVHTGGGSYQDYALQKQFKLNLRSGGEDIWREEMEPSPVGRHRWDVDSKQGRIERQQAPLLFQSGQGNPAEVHSFLKSMGGGIKHFALADTSTLNKIYRVYGLVPGADISGTAADMMYFVNRFGGAIDPVYHLLQVATQVSAAHHTFLEVALPLALNGLIDYHVGFYISLLPAGAVTGTAEILAALEAAQRHHLNHHMLIYYSAPGHVGGCFLCEAPDIFRFRSFSTGLLMLRYFAFIPPWPLESDIRDLCQIHHINLP